VTDLTTSRSSGRLGLTYRVGREVVVVHISLGCLKLIQSVKTLCLCKRSKCSNGTDLSLSSCEHGRTMNSRDDICLCSQRTDLSDLTSIRTFMIFEDHLADSLLLVLIYSLTENGKPFLIVCKSFFQLISDLADVILTCLLVIREYGNLHLFRRNDLLDLIKKLLRYCTGLVGMFLFSALCYDLVDEFDDLLVHFMSLVDSLDHLIFRDLISSGLNHDNLLSCRSNRKLKIRNCLLCKCRVDDKLAVDHTNLCGCAWTVKWDIRNTGCNGRTKHSRDLRIAFRINRHNHIYQSYVISVILWKQRTHRTVDNTGCKDCMLACLTLSLVESSRDLSYCIHLLLILNT